MKTLFETGDTVVKHLFVVKKDKKGETMDGVFMVFVGTYMGDEPSEDPSVLTDVVIFPAKKGVASPRYAGDVDFSDGFNELILANEKHSEYKFILGHSTMASADTEIEYGDFLEAYRKNS